MVAADPGVLRIVKTDASETVRQVLFEAHSSRLNVGTDPRTQIIMPMSVATCREDDKILIEYNASVTTIAGTGDCTYIIPIRKRNVRTGNTADSVLTRTDVDLGADVAVVAGKWTVIASYTVSAQEEVRLGQTIAENSRVYIDLVE